MNFSETIGSIGVGILLFAFLLNMIKVIKTESFMYPFLNLIGGALSCYASWLIPYFPFVILEGTWALVAGIALIRWFVKPARITR